MENDMRLLLVSTLPCSSSADTTVSACALDVRVGNFNDQIALQGLCHLCEHVLFTGSEIFPQETFSAFLGERLR
jgi:insulysin